MASAPAPFEVETGRRVRHTPMFHVFLRDDGVVLRSRFWLGAALRPYLPGGAGEGVGHVVNRRFIRKLALPKQLPASLAQHCVEEYANSGRCCRSCTALRALNRRLARTAL